MGKAFKSVTAALVIIGDEILSGRVQDKNLNFLCLALGEIGIQMRECRVVPDITAEIVAAVNHCRQRYDYVFTTGGIGPTHDDITADAIAAAFEVGIGYHPEALARLERHYRHTGHEFNTARKRMARIPDGGTLIDNPISQAPGFRVENVFVLAGVPVVAQAMFDSLKHQLVGGDPVASLTIAAYLPEGKIAAGLEQIQTDFPQVGLGSYPFYRDGRYGASIVARSQDQAALAEAGNAVRTLMRALGAEPIEASNDPG